MAVIAKELREARENAYWPDFVPGNTALSRAILDAIDIALPILEADPELVYRVAKALADIAGFEWHAFKYEAEAVLAAISTPTPVEES